MAKPTEREFRVLLRGLAGIERRRLDALKDAVRAQHKPGIGGSAICACGAPNGGTLACGALKEFLAAVDDATDMLVRMGPED